MKLLGVLLIGITYLSVASALQCYSCTYKPGTKGLAKVADAFSKVVGTKESELTEKCVDDDEDFEKKMADNKNVIDQCDKDYGCYKYKSATEDSQSVSRGCLTERMEEGCETEVKDGETLYKCHCKGDLCNGAISVNFQYPVALIMSIAAFLYAMF